MCNVHLLCVRVFRDGGHFHGRLLIRSVQRHRNFAVHSNIYIVLYKKGISRIRNKLHSNVEFSEFSKQYSASQFTILHIYVITPKFNRHKVGPVWEGHVAASARVVGEE